MNAFYCSWLCASSFALEQGEDGQWDLDCLFSAWQEELDSTVAGESAHIVVVQDLDFHVFVSLTQVLVQVGEGLDLGFPAFASWETGLVHMVVALDLGFLGVASYARHDRMVGVILDLGFLVLPCRRIAPAWGLGFLA